MQNIRGHTEFIPIPYTGVLGKTNLIHNTFLRFQKNKNKNFKVYIVSFLRIVVSILPYIAGQRKLLLRLCKNC